VVKPRDDKGFYVFEGSQTMGARIKTWDDKGFYVFEGSQTMGARIKTWDDKGKIDLGPAVKPRDDRKGASG